MAATPPTLHAIEHPAPHRDRARLAALWFGLTAAPLGWCIQTLSGAALAGHDCYPRQWPLPVPIWQSLWPILLAISVGGIALAIAGGAVAWHTWRSTRHERPDSAHHLMDRGEGRTRFMSMSGLITTALFLIALSFGTAALFMVPLCG